MDATEHRATSNDGRLPHQAGRRAAARRTPDELVVHFDLPDPLPITEPEIALISRHLSGVITGILDEPE